MNKKSVIFSGPVTTESGYGNHSRMIAEYLLSKEDSLNLHITFDITPWGNTPFLLDGNLKNGLIGKIYDRTGNRSQSYDVSIQCKLPNEFNPQMAKFNVGVSAFAEATPFNPLWIDCINQMNLIIVPSEFVKNIIFNSGRKVTVPVVVIPESFPNDLLLGNKPEQLDLGIELPDFNFLVFGQVTGSNPYQDRKNLFFTVKWFCENFSNDPDVGLIVKTNVGRNTKIDRNATQNLLTKLVAEVRRSPYPKIKLLHGSMTDKEVAALYQHPKIKALVSFHRGESYGLTLLEAAASGLPVIATNWSAPTEFLGDKFIKVDYQLQDVHETRIDNQIFMKGAKWAEANELDAKQKLSKFRVKSELPTEKAKELQLEVQSKYSFEAISKQYDQFLASLLSK